MPYKSDAILAKFGVSLGLWDHDRVYAVGVPRICGTWGPTVKPEQILSVESPGFKIGIKKIRPCMAGRISTKRQRKG